MEISLWHCFHCVHKFCYCVFIFIHLKVFSNFSWFFLTYWSFRNVLFHFHAFVKFSNFHQKLIPNVIPSWRASSVRFKSFERHLLCSLTCCLLCRFPVCLQLPLGGLVQTTVRHPCFRCWVPFAVLDIAANEMLSPQLLFWIALFPSFNLPVLLPISWNSYHGYAVLVDFLFHHGKTYLTFLSDGFCLKPYFFWY